MTQAKGVCIAKGFLKPLLFGAGIFTMVVGSPAVAELNLPSVGNQGCRTLERALFSVKALAQGSPFGVPLAEWSAADFQQIRSAMAACNRFIFSDSASELRQAQAQTEGRIDNIEKEASDLRERRESAAMQQREAVDESLRKKEVENEGETLRRRAEAILKDDETTGEAKLEIINGMLAALKNWSNRASASDAASDIYRIETQLMAKQAEAEKAVAADRRFKSQMIQCQPLLEKAGISGEVSSSPMVPGEYGARSTVGLFLCPFLKAGDPSGITIDAGIAAIYVSFGENELRLERRSVRDGYWNPSASGVAHPFVPIYGRLGEKEAKINNEGTASIFMMLSTQYLLNEYGPSVLK